MANDPKDGRAPSDGDDTQGVRLDSESPTTGLRLPSDSGRVTDDGEPDHLDEASDIPPDLAETAGPGAATLEPETLYLGVDFDPTPANPVPVAMADDEPPTPAEPRAATPVLSRRPEPKRAGQDSDVVTPQTPLARSYTQLDLESMPGNVRAMIENVQVGLPTREPSMIPTSRPTMGPYILLGRLGRDPLEPPEMENAVEVRGTATPRRVVIRRMRPEALVGSPIRRRRFEVSARLGMGLAHPNIVRTYEVGEQEGVPYLVREFVIGMNALGLVATQPADVSAVLALGEQITAALAYAYEQKSEDGLPLRLVHGAICPTALIIGRNGLARVTELSVAALEGRWLDPIEEARHGKPGYRAPEQVRGGRLGVQTDMFSLAMTLLHLLNGKAIDWENNRDALPQTIVATCRRRQTPERLIRLIGDMCVLRFEKRVASVHVVNKAFTNMLRERNPDGDSQSILRSFIPDDSRHEPTDPLQVVEGGDLAETVVGMSVDPDDI